MEDFRERADEKNDNVPIFQTVNMLDPRMAKMTNSIPYGLHLGAQDVTAYQQRASSASQSGLNFTVVLPSMGTVVSPVVLLRVYFEIVVQGTAAANGDYLFENNNITWCDYPLHDMISVMTVGLNSSNITWNAQESFQALKKLIPRAMVKKCGTMTPTGQDVFYHFLDAVNTLYDTFASFGKAYKENNNGGWTPSIENLKIVQVAQAAGVPASATIGVTLTEPLLLSPFCMSEDNPGFTGLQQLRLNVTFKQLNLMRMFKVNGGAIANFQINSINVQAPSNCELHMFYLNPSPSTKIERRCVSRYLNVLTNITSQPNIGATAIGDFNMPAATTTLRSTALQLGVIPKKIVIGARVPISSGPNGSVLKTAAERWFPITNVNISFSGRSGLLSTASQEQLYEMSVEAGLQDVSWQQFRGYVSNQFSNAGAMQYALTTSAPIVLDVGKHLTTGEPYYSTGSLAQVNFYLTVQIVNYLATESPVELVVHFLDEALLVNELGASSTYSGFVLKEQVLKCADMPPLDVASKNPNLIGGGGNWFKRSLSHPKRQKELKDEVEVFGSGRAAGMASGKVYNRIR